MNTGGVNPVPPNPSSAFAAGHAALAGRVAREARTAQERARELRGPRKDEVTLGHKAESDSDVDRVDTIDLHSDARGQQDARGQGQPQDTPRNATDPSPPGTASGSGEARNASDQPFARSQEPARVGRAGIPMPPTKHIDIAG
jgi:hypothetical protein